jgi:porphyrinogen peroxidase
MNAQIPAPVVPQQVTGPLTEAAVFLVLRVRPGSEPAAAELLGDVPGLVRSVGFRAPELSLSCVIGVGSDFWDAAYGTPKPAQLHPFRAVHGAKHSAPATPGDLLFHLRARRQDLCFELAHRIVDAFGGLATVEDEVHGFRYFDERDLLGFVDGTENPTGALAEAAALTTPGDPFPGSSHVVVQRYTHGLSAWRGLSVEDQEAAVGRTKLEDLELPDEAKAPDAHIVLNVVEGADGRERKILRDNMPFGSVKDGTFGTYFIGYAADVSTTELMLERMFTGADGAAHDRLLDFSTAHTGGLFFVPSQTFLDDPDTGLRAAAEA